MNAVPFVSSRPPPRSSRAVRRVELLVRKCGGASLFADAVGVSKRSVYRWILADRVPLEHERDAMACARRKGFVWRPPGPAAPEEMSALAWVS